MRFRVKEERLKKTARFGVLVDSIIKQFGLSDEFLIEAVRAKWPSVVGELVATHSLPNRIYSGIIYVAVDHSAYASEISMMRDTILEKIKSECSVPGLRDLRVTVHRDVFSQRASKYNGPKSKR